MRKHSEPHLSFFPLKDADLLYRVSSQDDIIQSVEVGCLCALVVIWNRSVLRPNICVIEQITDEVLSPEKYYFPLMIS